MNKKFYLTTLIPQEELNTPKRHFEINRPLTQALICYTTSNVCIFLTGARIIQVKIGGIIINLSGYTWDFFAEIIQKK